MNLFKSKETIMSNYIVFSANYLPHLGGVERYTYNMAKVMAANGHTVTIVTSDVSCKVPHEVDGNIQIFRLPSYKVLGERFPVLKFNRQLFATFKKIFSLHFDYGIINTRFYILSVVASVVLRKKNIPFVVVEHGTDHFTVNNKVFDFLGHIYEHLATEIIKRNTREFAGVSLACTEWLKHFQIYSSTVFYNAINLDEIEAAGGIRNEFRQMHSLPADAKIIVYCGRLVKEKGIEKLVAAMDCLNRSCPNAYLFIAGDGDLFAKINAMNNAKIILLGKVDFRAVISLLRDADIFCLPTEYPEGLPTSVLEAAACRCYIITTKFGGSSELILDESYGCILQKNTPEEIAQSILWALTATDLRESCTEKAYNKVVNSFEWSKVTQKIVSYTEAGKR